jgi:hypothetical protein
MRRWRISGRLRCGAATASIGQLLRRVWVVLAPRHATCVPHHSGSFSAGRYWFHNNKDSCLSPRIAQLQTTVDDC